MKIPAQHRNGVGSGHTPAGIRFSLTVTHTLEPEADAV